jgi:hypothetical protein
MVLGRVDQSRTSVHKIILDLGDSVEIKAINGLYELEIIIQGESQFN